MTRTEKSRPSAVETEGRQNTWTSEEGRYNAILARRCAERKREEEKIMVVATWKSGFGVFKADAQKVAEEIIAIGDEATPAHMPAGRSALLRK